LDMAKAPGILDRERKQAGQTQIQHGMNVSGPIGRLTGLDLVLTLDCYSSSLAEWRYGRSVCSWSAQVHPTPWVVFKRNSYDSNGHFKQQEFHGVRLVCKAGFFHVVSLYKTLHILVTIIVLMQFPTQLARFVACNALGPLSNIYQRLIYERFHEEEYIGALAMRLMNNSVLFLQLQDSNRGITKMRMLNALRTAMQDLPKDFCLNEQEIINFTDCCFRSVVLNQSVYHEKHGLAASLMNEVRGSFNAAQDCFVEQRLSNLPAHDVVGGYFYNTSLSSLEKISFQDIVYLFDQHRKRGQLERLFMPRALKAYAVDQGGDHTHGLRRLSRVVSHPFKHTNSHISSKHHAQYPMVSSEIAEKTVETVGHCNLDSTQQKQELLASSPWQQAGACSHAESETNALRFELEQKLDLLEQRVVLRFDTMVEQIEQNMEQRVVLRFDTVREQIEQHQDVVEGYKNKIGQLEQQIAELSTAALPQQQFVLSNDHMPQWAGTMLDELQEAKLSLAHVGKGSILEQLQEAQQRLTLLDTEVQALRHDIGQCNTRQRLPPVWVDKAFRVTSRSSACCVLSREKPDRTFSRESCELRTVSEDDREADAEVPQFSQVGPVTYGLPHGTPRNLLGSRSVLCISNGAPSLSLSSSPRSDSSFVRLWRAELEDGIHTVV